jgi:hypothetical protein
VKKINSTKAWACGVSLALMLAVSGGTAWSQGIVYVSPQPQPYYSLFGGILDFDLDINGDGTTDFILRSGDSDTSVNNAVLIPQGDNTIVVQSSYVANMNVGDTVGSSLNSIYQWSNAKTPISTLAILLGQQSAEDGNFAGQPSGYMGFDFVVAGANYYGWIYVSSPVNDAGIYANVVEWAYESDANTPITISAAPEPSTWALLAVGGAVLLLRKTRKTA